MSGIFRPIVLLLEAPSPPSGPPEDLDAVQDPPEDPTADDSGDGMPEDDEDDADTSGDVSVAPEDAAGPSLEADQRREQLLDALEAVSRRAAELSTALSFVLERAKGGSDDAAEAKRIVDEVVRQVGIVIVNFPGLGPDRAEILLGTARERVAATAEIVKHLIDGDEDFRDPGSDVPNAGARD